MLNEWHTQRRLIVTPTEQEGVFMGLVIELTPTGIVTVGRPAAEAGRSSPATSSSSRTS